MKVANTGKSKKSNPAPDSTDAEVAAKRQARGQEYRCQMPTKELMELKRQGSADELVKF